jgi:hypothetical protein
MEGLLKRNARLTEAMGLMITLVSLAGCSSKISCANYSADPRRAVTSGLIEQMQPRGVFQPGGLLDGRGTTDCLMTGTIGHLEAVEQGSNISIEVALSARLVNLRTGEVIWQSSASKRTKLDQRSVPLGGFAAGEPLDKLSNAGDKNA